MSPNNTDFFQRSYFQEGIPGLKTGRVCTRIFDRNKPVYSVDDWINKLFSDTPNSLYGFMLHIDRFLEQHDPTQFGTVITWSTPVPSNGRNWMGSAPPP
jgi:hypothetical protein